MRKFGLESDKQGFRIIYQEYFSLLKVCRSAYYYGHVSNCAGDSRKLLQMVKSLCRKSCGNTLPAYINSVQLATFHLFGKLLKKLLLINFYIIMKKMPYFHIISQPIIILCLLRLSFLKFRMMSC